MNATTSSSVASVHKPMATIRTAIRPSTVDVSKCHQCGQSADTHTNCKNDGCHLLFIQCETCAAKYDGCCSEVCQTVYNMPLEEQKELRKGIDKGMMIFNKSKKRLRPRLDEMNAAKAKNKDQ